MAKCIAYPRNIIARVSDEKAHAEVRAGRARYCPKHWWKVALRKPADDVWEGDESG